MYSFLLFVFSAMLCHLVVAEFIQSTVSECCHSADTEYGSVCGLLSSYEPIGSTATEFVSFLAVPYSEQPLGDRRFAELGPPEPWDDYLNTTTVGPVCMQYDFLDLEVTDTTYWDEECIHANVYVPLDALPSAQTADSCHSTSLRPVVVFIHGGGFGLGSGNPDFYGPEYMVERGLVLVTFNYRINVFGFMSLNTKKVPGNAGLRDQLGLLKWVQRNIANFGGDPNDVTLMGQSAGSTSVHLMTLSPAAQGLFQRAVLMSGSAVRSYFSPSKAYASAAAAMLTTQLGISTTDPDEIYEQLICLPAEVIRNAIITLTKQAAFLIFVPVVENVYDNITTILPDTPENLLAAGYGNNIPMIMGNTNNESQTFLTHLADVDFVDTVIADQTYLIPPLLNYSACDNNLTAIVEMIKAEYFTCGIDTFSLEEYFSLINFVYPMTYLASHRAAANAATTYLYQFSYEGVFRVFQVVNGFRFYGAAHLEDLTYYFRTNSFAYTTDVSRKKKSQDRDMQDWMTSLLLNFTLTSNPTNDCTNWFPVAPGALQYQDLRTPGVYSMMPLNELQNANFNFFNNLYEMYST